MIEDMLADRHPDTQPDEVQIAAVLQELGKPAKVAASYHQERYLIGPRVFPTFIKIMQIVFAAVIGAIILSLVVSYLVNYRDEGVSMIFSLAWNALPGLISGLFTAFGILVVVFHFSERWFGISSEFEDEQWDPKDLPEKQDEPYNPVMMSVGMVLMVILVIFLNFFPHLIGMFAQTDGEWQFLPLLSENFFKVLPFINIGIALNICLNIAVLSRGKWETWSLWTKQAVGLYDFFIILMILRSRPLIGINPAFMSFYNLSSQQAAQLQPLYELIDFSVVLALVVAVVVIGIMWVIELIQKIFRGSDSIPQLGRM
ncbi:MAG: hypothetical protein GWN04_03480 [Gammaproteobacteria bacterium]|nr:hypothetical protein [candidate division Zixibacteria bacterium]NIX17378.1 hypothetical protein [Gammaproteobacteria bacterium]